MEAITHELSVTSVQANGWGVLVTAEFFDRGSAYNSTATRSVEFMCSSHEQPRVRQRLKLTVEEES